MANYYCQIRTNYFRVNDPDAFREFMSRVYTTEDDLELWEGIKGDDLLFGFGAYSGILGYMDKNPRDVDDQDDWDDAFDKFIDGIQKYIADGDAVIIIESGYEKLRYLVGSATIITSDNYEYFDISEIAVARAREILGNNSWKTKISY